LAQSGFNGAPMRWITAESEFQSIFLRARTCVCIDSGRIQTQLHRLVFDDAEVCTNKFAGLVQKLMDLSGDLTTNYIVLDPDPVHYFYSHFKKYPALEILHGDSAKAYLGLLNEDPGRSPADAVGTNWWACVIVPPSLNWFIHALRSNGDNGGHIWIPSIYVERIQEIYPYARMLG
jgi:hypothetical protein